jgi:glycosyltransferase involved in cell wall biosynthesis
MSNIKLLVIIQKDPLGEGIGGMHTFIKGLVKYLPDDFEVELVGITTDRISRPVGKWNMIEFNQKKINFFPVLYTQDQNKRDKVPLSLRFELSLFRYKSKIPLKDRILEFHRPEPAILFNKTRNKKVIYIHGNVKDLYNPYSEKKWSSIPWLYFKLEDRVMPWMDKIFVVSEKGLNFYKERYDHISDRFSFMPTWVDKDIFHPLQSGLERKDEIKKLIGEFPISKDDKILLFAGRLEGQKNPLLLIDSFHELYIRNKDVKLLIVGNGSLRGKVIERINGYGLREKVKLLNIFPQDKLARLMRVCDIFVLTSAYEGMPRAVIEALASGIPVVSTDVGDTWRVVKDKDSGLLVSKHNAAEVAEAIIEILENKKNFSADKCLNAVKCYSMDIILGNIYKIYRNLAAFYSKS